MKTLFIPAQIHAEINKEKIKSLSAKLPKNIAIAYSIQFKDVAFEIKSLLKNNVTAVVQVLGCSKPLFSKETKAILLIGSGRFHATSLAQETKLPIYILEKNTLIKISEQEIESFERKEKAAYLRFLHADKIGILISTKPGQQNLKRAINIKNKIKGKDCYLFLGNDFNTLEFENFPINAWVNTACPRLDMDLPILNIKSLEKNIK